MKKLLMGTLIFLSAAGVFAGSEDESVTRAKYDVEMKNLIAEMNASCGFAIEAKIDWDSFTGSDWQNYDIASFCGAPVKALSNFCNAEKGNGKAYIRKTIRSVTCSYGGDNQRALLVEDGMIKNIVDFKAPNLEDFIRAAMIEKL
jgi:hypothetical protein